MWKWLKKFALEIAPPVTATVLGAFVVHQLWPSGDPKPQPAITPPAAQAPAESAAKPASLPSAETNTTAAVPAATPSPATATSAAPKAGKPGRQSSEVAKTAPRDEPPAQRPESEASVLDRAEKALATIPPAKSAGPSLPTRGASPPPPSAVTMHEPQASPAPSPVPAPAPAVTTAAVAPTEPPPMDPPREIGVPASSIAAPPPSLLPQNQQAHTKNNNPLRVSHSDRENLADIPVDDAASDQAPAAAASADAAPPTPPAKPKNIIENIFAPLQSVLPERMRN